jgi:hypothetical protein
MKKILQKATKLLSNENFVSKRVMKTIFFFKKLEPQKLQLMTKEFTINFITEHECTHLSNSHIIYCFFGLIKALHSIFDICLPNMLCIINIIITKLQDLI